MKPFAALPLLVLASGPAWAQEAGVDKEEEGEKDEVDVEGRVFVRSTVSRLDLEGIDDEPVIHELSLASARLTVDYRLEKRFKVVVEAELAENDLDLKDVFARARLKKDLHLVAGQFKKPISPIALESAWRLPLVERGLLGDLDSVSTAPDSSVPLPFGGRGIGVAAELDLDAPMSPQLTAAVFQHSVIFAPSGDRGYIDLREAVPLDPYLRGRIEPAPEVRFGGTVALITHRNSRTDAPETIDHAPLVSLDAEVERGPVKFWLEAFLGGSTVYGDSGRAEGTMAGARALVALRADGVAPWLQRLEPFAALSFVDPVLADAGDDGLQGATGASFLFHERLRLQVELEVTRVPDPLRLNQSSRNVIYTQLGAVF